MTLENALTYFLLDQQVRGNSPSTLVFYRSCTGTFSRFAGENVPMEAITLPLLKSYYLHLLEKGICSITIQSYVRALRAFLSWAYQQEIIPLNLSEKFRLPKARRKVIDILTDEELKRLLSCFSARYLVQLRNLCICALMLDSGLRLNEVVTLTVSAVHVAEGYAIVLGKGDKERVVPLGLLTRKYLMQYMIRRPGCVATDRLFLSNQLDAITESTLKNLFRKLKKRTGIPRLKAHLLRHTFATRYLENGGDIYSLQQILGHTSLEMVKRYIHTTHRKTVTKFTDFSPLDNLR